MENNTSKKILFKWLKENKMFGSAILYLSSNSNTLQLPSNIEIVNKYGKLADEAIEFCDKKKHLINMIGNTMSLSPIIIENNNNVDFLYHLYKRWCTYVSLNWNEIQRMYYMK